ncbi:acyl-CoA N-acyltransferase [Sparassis latifolia]
MSFVNLYKPPPPPAVLPESELYGPEPYDINFAFPLQPPTLECARVRLEPFVPAEHARAYWDALRAQGTAPFRFYPFYQRTLPEFLSFLEHAFRRAPTQLMLAIIDKTPQPTLAGVLALVNTHVENRTTEIGHVLVFPAFRHTHVAKTAVGLLLRYCLQRPGADPPGLGMRRVAWCAHPRNAPSIGLAERMGMQREGHLRWLWVLPEALAAEGREPAEEDPVRGYGRDTVLLSLCWDEWEGRGRDAVEAIIGD